MFSKWLNTGLKAARRALDAGRFDEAFARLSQRELRNHSQANELLSDLGKALVARARIAAQAGKGADALADLQKAAAVGPLPADAAALRDRIESSLRAADRQEVATREAVARAAETIAAGRLESAHAAVNRVLDADQRQILADEVEQRARRAGASLEQASAALAAGNLQQACEFWHAAVAQHRRSAAVDALARQIAGELSRKTQEAFGDGRIDRVQAMLRTAKDLIRFDDSLEEQERLASLAGQAAARLAARDFDGLHDLLLRMSVARDVPWVRSALKELDQLFDARSRLIASPIGLIATAAPDRRIVAEPLRAVPPPGLSAGGGGAAAPLDRRLLMLVDGTGSGLLIARDVVRIGRASAGAPADVPFPADVQSPHAEIRRQGDGYFLVAHAPTTVNQRSVSRALLRDGDRIVLGPQAKFTFRLPSSKSGTAVLQLSDRAHLPEDVSFVVLFKDTCIVGPQSSCHIRTREGDCRFVLFERAGGLHVRKAARDGQPTGPADAIVLDRTCDIGDVRVTAKLYQAQTSV